MGTPRRVFLLLLMLALCCGRLGRGSVIIPEELPSLLSVAYSNIPPIKKGTDSRVGFGFAFGNHADFQVLLELGPQTNTMNLTGQAFGAAPAASAKRHVSAAPEEAALLTRDRHRDKASQSEAGKHLSGWAHKMKYPKPARPADPPHRPGDVPNLEDSLVELVRNDKGQYEIRQPTRAVPAAALEALSRLHRPHQPHQPHPPHKAPSTQRSQAELDRLTADLADVSLD